MKTPSGSLRRLHAVDDRQIDELADVLIDCVEGGASVSFMHPLTRDRAVHFHPVTIDRDDGDTVEVSSGVATGDRLVLNINSAIVEGQKVRDNGAQRGQTATVAMSER